MTREVQIKTEKKSILVICSDLTTTLRWFNLDHNLMPCQNHAIEVFKTVINFWRRTLSYERQPIF